MARKRYPTSRALALPKLKHSPRPPPRWSPKQVYAFAVIFTVIILGVHFFFFAPRTTPHKKLLRGPWSSASSIAFHLTPTSGVASIYFQNGTTVDIARIAGPYPYQFCMANASSLSQDRPNTYFCNAFSSLQYGLPVLNLPTPTNCLSPAVLAVRPLLSSLKEAVESYYGTNICFASIVLDDAPFGLCQSTAGAALRSIGLTPVEIHPDHRALSATNLYVRSEMPLMAPSPDSVRDEEPLTVLALNYEPSSFNTALFLVEDELVWPVRSTITSPTVMTNANSLAQLSALQSGLRHLIASPPYDDLFDFASPLHIDELILFGESAHDASLHSLLLGVLGANLTEEAYVDDSPFTAARAAAKRALEVMQDPYFQMKDRGWWPFACQCRSGLYLTSWRGMSFVLPLRTGSGPGLGRSD